MQTRTLLCILRHGGFWLRFIQRTTLWLCVLVLTLIRMYRTDTLSIIVLVFSSSWWCFIQLSSSQPAWDRVLCFVVCIGICDHITALLILPLSLLGDFFFCYDRDLDFAEFDRRSLLIVSGKCNSLIVGGNLASYCSHIDTFTCFHRGKDLRRPNVCTTYFAVFLERA